MKAEKLKSRLALGFFKKMVFPQMSEADRNERAKTALVMAEETVAGIEHQEINNAIEADIFITFCEEAITPQDLVHNTVQSEARQCLAMTRTAVEAFSITSEAYFLDEIDDEIISRLEGASVGQWMQVPITAEAPVVSTPLEVEPFKELPKTEVEPPAPPVEPTKQPPKTSKTPTKKTRTPRKKPTTKPPKGK